MKSLTVKIGQMNTLYEIVVRGRLEMSMFSSYETLLSGKGSVNLGQMNILYEIVVRGHLEMSIFSSYETSFPGKGSMNRVRRRIAYCLSVLPCLVHQCFLQHTMH